MAIRTGDHQQEGTHSAETTTSDRLRWAPSPLFLVAAICFSFPFFTGSCGPDVVTVTGAELATGAGIDASSPDAAREISEKLPDLFGLVALLTVILGIWVARPGRRRGSKAGLILGGISVLALAGLPMHIILRFLPDTLFVRYGWIFATVIALVVVAIEDLLAIRARLLGDGSERVLATTTARAASVMTILFAVGAIPILTLGPNGEWEVWSIYAVFLAVVAVAHGATEGRSLAELDARRVAWSSIGLIVLGIAVAATGALQPINHAGLAPAAAISGTLAYLAGFIVGVRALKRVGPGVRGRWPAVVGTSVASLPVFGLLFVLLVHLEGI